MILKREKRIGYSLFRISCTITLVILLILSTYAISLKTIATSSSRLNNPPNIPSNPFPANGSTNVSLTLTLNWTGGDPDGDNVTYNVYFEANTSVPTILVSENQTATSYNSTLLKVNTTYSWQIVAFDNHSAKTMGPLWYFTTRKNHAPNIPSNPNPANNSLAVSVSVLLSWTGGDPDLEDTVTYDVYFGLTSTPPQTANNQSGTSFNPGTLAFNTKYYWRIISWDNHNISTLGPLWQFTTKIEEQVTVSIIKPEANAFYLLDKKLNILSSLVGQRTIIIGTITIVVNATATTGISKVEFYIDGELKNTTTAPPYNYTWGLSLQLKPKHIIMVKAYDTSGNNATAMINVSRPLPFFLVGVGALAALSLVHIRLIPRTTVTGLVYNFKETGGMITFFALRIKYTSSGLLQSETGIIRFKRCTMSFPVGPKAIFQFGPLHNLAWVSLSCLGKIHYTSPMAPHDILSELFPSGQCC